MAELVSMVQRTRGIARNDRQAVQAIHNILVYRLAYVVCNAVIFNVFMLLLKGRTNLPPEKVPWDALRTLMSDCIYGGKIDNDFDQV